MADMMTFPNTVEEFIEQYKIVDTEKIYTNGTELVPIFRMMQWFKHVSATDTISRQTAIEAFEDTTYTKNEIRRRITELPSVQSEQRWIPCNERLPEAGVRYQVTFESGEVGYADFRNKIFLSDGSAKENIWEIERYYKDDGEVIAWMPLPEPYKEGDMNER